MNDNSNNINRDIDFAYFLQKYTKQLAAFAWRQYVALEHARGFLTVFAPDTQVKLAKNADMLRVGGMQVVYTPLAKIGAEDDPMLREFVSNYDPERDFICEFIHPSDEADKQESTIQETTILTVLGSDPSPLKAYKMMQAKRRYG